MLKLAPLLPPRREVSSAVAGSVSGGAAEALVS